MLLSTVCFGALALTMIPAQDSVRAQTREAAESFFGQPVGSFVYNTTLRDRDKSPTTETRRRPKPGPKLETGISFEEWEQKANKLSDFEPTYVTVRAADRSLAQSAKESVVAAWKAIMDKLTGSDEKRENSVDAGVGLTTFDREDDEWYGATKPENLR